MELNKETVTVAESAARGIHAFYNMLGTESDDEVNSDHYKLFHHVFMSPRPMSRHVTGLGRTR